MGNASRSKASSSSEPRTKVRRTKATRSSGSEFSSTRCRLMDSTSIGFSMSELLDRWRRDTPGAAERIHLNNAGAALMPQPVLDACKTHLDLEARIGGYEAADA